MNLKQALIDNDSIRLGLEAKDWKEAVKVAVDPLIESGAILPEYYDAIIESTEEYGPYYILMPGMAMPHARPEAGVQRDAFSLITLQNPVVFSDGKEVSVLLALAATSSKIHTSVAIPQIIALFELEDSIARLQVCQTKEDVLTMIEESKDSPYLEDWIWKVRKRNKEMTKRIPNLQVALDHSDLQGAIKAAVSVGQEVDIIEAGTVCLLQVGSELVEVLRSLFPDKIIVADTKCADAGGTVAKNNAVRGADWMTCICCATIPTMEAALKAIMAERGDRGEIQIELYGDWTFEQAQLWLDAGISQAIYHQSRDALLAGETWGEKDLNKVKKLIDMGFRVSVTGGLDVDTLKLFEGVDVFTFIAGRGITEAADPAGAARAFKDEIRRIWG